MKKPLLCITLWMLFVISVATPLFAQEFGYAGEYALPQGKFTERAKPGYGITTFYFFPITRSIEMNARTGLILWPKKSNNSLSFSAVPVVMGLQYYLSPGIIRPLLLVEVGGFLMRTGAVVIKDRYGDYRAHTVYQFEKGVSWGAGLQINTSDTILSLSIRSLNITGDFSNLVVRLDMVLD